VSRLVCIGSSVYPSECLQTAFNILLDAKRKSLTALPNMPDDMPDSYCEMLEGLLTYRHKQHKSAGDLLTSDFVQFHNNLEEEGKDEIQDMVATTTPFAQKEQMRCTHPR